MCCLVYWYDTGRWSRDDWLGAEAVSATYWDSGPVTTDGSAVYKVGGPETYLDEDDNWYRMSVTMGWARFGDMHAFKRVWRVLVTLKMFEQSSLYLNIQNDFSEEGDAQEATFDSANVGVDEGVQVRLHLRRQKLTSIRVYLSDVEPPPPGEGGILMGQGFELYGVGYELGIKRGAVKLPATRSL